MLYDMFDKTEALNFQYGSASKLIRDLRATHLSEGFDPIDFPKYLEDAGVRTLGQLIEVNDEFLTMARLKYGA